MTFKVHFDAGKALYKNKKYDQALIKILASSQTQPHPPRSLVTYRPVSVQYQTTQLPVLH
jgi:hypothetical protein